MSANTPKPDSNIWPSLQHVCQSKGNSNSNAFGQAHAFFQGDHGLSEDAVQDAEFSLSKRALELPRLSPAEWHSIVRNKCVDVLRKRNGTPEPEADEDTEVADTQPTPTTSWTKKKPLLFTGDTTADGQFGAARADESTLPPSHSLAEVHRATLIQQHLANLSEKHQALLRAYYFEDKTQAEIAANFGMTENAVNCALAAARVLYRAKFPSDAAELQTISNALLAP
jgi:RNA polymerase sigma factor (sigma-70 family)